LKHWRIFIVSKVMVLVFGDEDASSSIIDAVIAGANSVRFTEAEVRRAPVPDDAVSSRRASLASAADLANADGVVLVVVGDASASDVRALLHDAAHASSLEHVVFAVAPDAPATVAALAATSAIIVTDAAGGTPAERATRLGRRVARLSGWVRHGLGHEAEHEHGHGGHAHSHHH
jgi:hypothetical protein